MDKSRWAGKQGMRRLQSWLPPEVKAMPNPGGATLISGHDMLFVEITGDIPRGRKWLLETLATKPGVSVLQVDDSGTSVAGQKSGGAEDEEPLRLCAPPNWAWRACTVKTLKVLVKKWYDAKLRGHATAAITRLGKLEPTAEEQVSALLKTHGWEKVDESVWRFPDLDTEPGGGGSESPASGQVAASLPGQVP